MVVVVGWTSSRQVMKLRLVWLILMMAHCRTSSAQGNLLQTVSYLVDSNNSEDRLKSHTLVNGPAYRRLIGHRRLRLRFMLNA